MSWSCACLSTCFLHLNYSLTWVLPPVFHSHWALGLFPEASWSCVLFPIVYLENTETYSRGCAVSPSFSLCPSHRGHPRLSREKFLFSHRQRFLVVAGRWDRCQAMGRRHLLSPSTSALSSDIKKELLPLAVACGTDIGSGLAWPASFSWVSLCALKCHGHVPLLSQVQLRAGQRRGASHHWPLGWLLTQEMPDVCGRCAENPIISHLVTLDMSPCQA